MNTRILSNGTRISPRITQTLYNLSPPSVSLWREGTSLLFTSLLAQAHTGESTISSVRSMLVSGLHNEWCCTAMSLHQITPVMAFLGEWISGATCMFIANYLAENYGNDDRVSRTSRISNEKRIKFLTGYKSAGRDRVCDCSLCESRWLCSKFT